MRRALQLMVFVLTLCGNTAGAAEAADVSQKQEVLSTFLSSGGPGPYIVELTILRDGTVLLGPIGEAKACASRLQAAELKKFDAKLQDSRETLLSAWISWHEEFSDTSNVTFLLTEPPGPGAETEVMIPIELFPVSLLPLAEALDAIEAGACGSKEWGIVARVRN